MRLTRQEGVLVRSTASSQGAAPVSLGTPFVAVGLRIPAGEQLAAGPAIAFVGTPQHKWLSSSMMYN